MTRGIDWSRYVSTYHHDRPGITEQALKHARHASLGTAYEWLASALPHPAGDVVDLASGNCAMQPHLASRSYRAVDSSDSEVAAARRAGRGPVRIGDVTALDLPESSADTVVMSMALMLVPLAPTLDEVARVLRPGGTFAATVPAPWPVLPRDVVPTAVLSAALRGPGSLPALLGPRRLAHALAGAGLQPLRAHRARFPFPVRSAADAHLAVRSLYTPGRRPADLRRAERWLARLPGPTELPVPLLRVVASKPADAGPGV